MTYDGMGWDQNMGSSHGKDGGLDVVQEARYGSYGISYGRVHVH